MDPDTLSALAGFAVLDGILAIKFVVLLVLLVCSALISGAEVAFFGLSQTELNEIEEEKSTKGKIVVHLLSKPKKLLATILVTNNAINIGIVLLFNDIGDTIFSNINYQLFGFLSVRFLLEVLVATFLILMFGEILTEDLCQSQSLPVFTFYGLSAEIPRLYIHTLKHANEFNYSLNV